MRPERLQPRTERRRQVEREMPAAEAEAIAVLGPPVAGFHVHA
jgi:hypothetical protein